MSTSSIHNTQGEPSGFDVVINQLSKKSDSQDSGFRSTSRERLRSDSRSPHRAAQRVLQGNNTPLLQGTHAERMRTYENAGQRSHGLSSPSTSSSGYQNYKPTSAAPLKAVVAPTVYHEKQEVTSFSMVELSSRNNNNDILKDNNLTHYHSVEDIPGELDGLSVSQVCECLSLLNMEGYIQEFRRQQIDGNLLKGLNESVLQREFCFTEFNASKLMRFVRGWRPRFS